MCKACLVTGVRGAVDVDYARAALEVEHRVVAAACWSEATADAEGALSTRHETR